MFDSNQSVWPVALKLHRVLMAASLTLSIALLWGETRGQAVQSVMHGAPLIAVMICSLTLLAASLVIFRSQRRLAIYGLLTSLVGLFACLFPTL